MSEDLSRCNHGTVKAACETCAAWEAAIYSQKRAEKAEAEVERLNGEVKRLTEWQAVLKTLHAAIDAAGLDVSPCLKCGCLVVCLPDGMPMCKACAEKQEGGR